MAGAEYDSWPRRNLGQRRGANSSDCNTLVGVSYKKKVEILLLQASQPLFKRPIMPVI